MNYAILMKLKTFKPNFMKTETNVYYLERTIEVKYKIRIEKEEEKYFAYLYDELSQATRKIECWVQDDYHGSVDAEECDTEAEWDAVIDSFKAYIEANGVKYARMCDKCGKGMNDGYCVNGGDEYYCSPECLHQEYDKQEWQEMYANGFSDQNYWTDWEDEEDYQYILFNNQLLEI